MLLYMIAKFKTFILILAFSLSTLMTASSAYALDSKTKALGSMALYGTVGGALLGTASMAFGTSERSIAVGASLGLYTGLLFGSYIVLTYTAKKNNWNFGAPQEYYDSPAPSPYGDEAYAPSPYRSQPVTLEERSSFDRYYQKKTGDLPVFYTDLLRLSF